MVLGVSIICIYLYIVKWGLILKLTFAEIRNSELQKSLCLFLA